MRGTIRFAVVILTLSVTAYGQTTQPTTQPVRGRIGENLSYLKPQSGRVLINAGAQGELPVAKPGSLQWQVLIGPKGSRAYDGDYVVKADEAITFSVVNSPARVTAPGVVTLAVTSNEVSPQLNLFFPGRTELPPGIMVLRPGYTEQQAREQVFTNEFLALMRRLNPGVIRAMDWQRTNGNESVEWADRCTPADLIWGVKGKGGPIEPVIDLCNALGADLWVNIPHKASDDYVRQLLTLIRARLNPGLRVYVEYTNEPWNNAGGFPQTEWLRQQGDADPQIVAALPAPGQRTQRGRWAYAKRVQRIGTIAKGEVFADQPDRVVMMLSGQTGDSSVLRDMLAAGFKPDALSTAGYFNADRNATTADGIFATFAANARALYGGTQIQKFNQLADSGPYRKLIYEWQGVVDSAALAQATRDDARWGGVMLAAGAGIFGNDFEAAALFVPLSDAESKYGATDEVGRLTAKAQAVGDLSAGHRLPTYIEMKADPAAVAALKQQLKATQAEAEAAKAQRDEALNKITAAKAALGQ